jgi:hypothetical protein
MCSSAAFIRELVGSLQGTIIRLSPFGQVEVSTGGSRVSLLMEREEDTQTIRRSPLYTVNTRTIFSSIDFLFSFRNRHHLGIGIRTSGILEMSSHLTPAG